MDLKGKWTKKKIIVVISVICVIILFFNNNREIPSQIESVAQGEKQQQQISIVAGTPNVDNFTYVISKDGIQVPVPKGYSVSSVEDEQYVNGVITSESYYLQDELNFTSDGEYPWIFDETTGGWKSGNKGVRSSTSILNSYEFTITEETVVRLNCSVSSALYNYLIVDMIDTSTNELVLTRKFSGTSCGTRESSLIYLEVESELLTGGTYKINLTYKKGYDSDSGLDTAYLKSAGVYTKTATGEEITVYNKEHSGGFVIYEGEDEVPEDDSQLVEAQKNRNQYVWVPISSEELENMYHISDNELYGNYYEFPLRGYSLKREFPIEPLISEVDKDNTFLKQYMDGITGGQFLAETRQRFYEMLQSVATYGGFYIGRYETGDLSRNIPVVRKMNDDIDGQTWYKMYQKCKELSGSNNAVETNMIWGIQWDETLKWLVESGERAYWEIALKSTSWGNYRGSTFLYTDISGITYTKEENSRLKLPTGATEYAKVNNIYDLAGNVYERTMEVLYGYRAIRGGYYSTGEDDEPASVRYGVHPDGENYGCRAVLYIK